MSANGTSQGFDCQKAYTATPSAASTRSVARYSGSNRPVSRNVKPRARRSITASRMWLTATKTTQAASPASDSRNASLPIPECSRIRTRPTNQAAIAESE